jgi:hypothetical protein
MMNGAVDLFFKNLHKFTISFDVDKEYELICAILETMEEIILLG